MIELILPLILGTLVGTFTGIFPGIHINLVSAILLSHYSFFAIAPLSLVVFIVSLAITHTFLDFIPSVFLGAPDEDNFLSILPGHQLLMQGKGQEAVILTLYGSLIAIPIILIISPIFINFLPPLYTAIKLFIPYILIFVSLFLICREKEPALSLLIFLLSGFLGLITFSLPVKEPLMPLLTGLFGLSSLIISLKDKPFLTKQEILPLSQIKLPKKDFLKSFLSALISAPLCSFLPGIGSGHAAVIGSEIIPQERKGFLFLVGSINTIVMGLSFVTAYSIGKTRTGAAAAIKEILQTITKTDLFIILLAIVLSGIIAFAIGVQLTKVFSAIINKINYQKLNFIIILLLIVINIIFSNPIGIIVLISSASIGIFAISSNSRRINLMGCLILPSIVYYLIN
jgi:putative membrane protein